MTVQEENATPRSLFLAAIMLPDDEARQVFVDLACRDNSELKAKVLSLLEVRKQASSSPIDFAVQVGTQHTEPIEPDKDDLLIEDEKSFTCTSQRDGDDLLHHPRIGPYKLLEQIGQGGMGVVYMAQQTTPVKRKVALKIIKPGMDSREVVARFEAERQALAIMEHPNIARVLDGGLEEQGRPYFVMELVRGVPLTDYCRSNEVGIEDRLNLFRDICRAVQHAHQKGIIHRDLKPSNILVTLHDGVPVVKVIDFGVAKALHHELTERTLFTHFSQMIGTPLYMAPEQAELSGLDIDTRSDIYSLGVILYELLTGTTPFERETLSKLGLDGFRKVLREQEPPRPSVRLSTLNVANVPTLDGRRQASTKEFQLRLKRELDWVVMKALAKDRERRYESASALAADIERYLAQEQVQACPPTLAYRLRTYSRRHRGILATTAVIAFVSILATAVSITFALSAQSEKQRAVQSESLADERLKQSQLDFNLALQALDTIVQEVSSPEFAQLPGIDRIRSDILDRAMQFYTAIIDEHNNDPYARMHKALAHYQIALIHDGAGEYAAVQEQIDKSIRDLEQLIRENPDDLQFQLSLTQPLFSRMHSRTASLEEHVADAERCLEITEKCTTAGLVDDPYQLALLYWKAAEWLPPNSQRAREMVQKSIHISTSRGLDPVPSTQLWMAERARQSGNFEEAMKFQRRGIELLEKLGADTTRRNRQIELWLATHELARLAHFQLELKQTLEAEKTMLVAFERALLLHREYGKDARAQYALTERAYEISDYKLAHVNATDSSRIVKEATELLTEHPKTDSSTLIALAWLQLAEEKYADVLESLDKAVEVSSEGVQVHVKVARILMRGRYVKLANKEKALHYLLKALERDPADYTVLEALADLQIGLFDDYQAAEEYVKRLRQIYPNSIYGLEAQAQIHVHQKNLDEAIACMDRVIERSPAHYKYWYRADLHLQNGNLALAIADYNNAERAHITIDTKISARRFRAIAYFQYGEFAAALKELSDLVETFPDNRLVHNALSNPLLATSTDKSFRSGILSLLDRLVQLNQGSQAALNTRDQVRLNFGAGETD